ncbi:MAG: TIGR03118 family protein, partial [Chloroflexi bacterium]
MRRIGMTARRRLRRIAALSLLGLVAVIATGGSASGAVTLHGFRQINLVSDIPGRAQLTDSHLVNPWGIAAGPTTPLWVADNGTDVATLYSGSVHGSAVTQVPLVVSVPGGAPTGQVFNPTNGFKLSVGDMRVPSKFIFDSEAGTITAWTLTDPVQTSARTKLTVPGAVFKGLALSFFDNQPALYATDFAHGRVVVVDSHFHRVATPGKFEDAMLPPRFAPFGIQAIGHRIVVSYAERELSGTDEVHGAGLGFVDVFSRDGKLVSRLVRRGNLNAPWGLVR